MTKEKNSDVLSIHELTWPEIREDILKVNPVFVKIVDNLSLDNSYTVFKARYPYGAKILDHAKFQLPNEHHSLVPLTDSSISDHIRNQLGYNVGSNPVSMLLKNKMELFLSLGDHTVPAGGLISTGNIFGTYRILSKEKYPGQPAFIWDMTAGARSIFMLPKISEIDKHKNLNKYLGIRSDTPKKLFDHWHVFKDIADCYDFSTPWYIEIIFFTRKWFKSLEDKAWREFYCFLLEDAWRRAEFWSNSLFWKLIFSLIQKEKNLRPSEYISDSVNHIFAISSGALPGFMVALDNEAAPISDIQKAYLEIYKLRDYLPLIMQPGIFNMDAVNRAPIYYSLQFPSAFELGQSSRINKSLVQDLYEIKWLLEKYLFEMASGKFNIENTPLFEITKGVKYDYFHDKRGTYSSIRLSENIFREDKNFTKVLIPCRNKKPPINAPFVKGCIRIS